MANTALTDKAICLTALGRYAAAADAYTEAIRVDEELGDARGAAADKSQLATVRMYQKRYAEALELNAEVRTTFQKLEEPRSVASVWHQIAMVHEWAGQYDAAEKAYQESLRIEVQIGNRAGEAQTLTQLGNLYSRMERREEAVRFYRQAVHVGAALGDLWSEGTRRSNVAQELVKLKRYDEARVELERAIKCLTPFGHVGQLWKPFAILSKLEREVGNDAAARQAHIQAMQAYLSYRRAGGASQAPAGGLCTLVAQDPGAAAQQLAGLQQETNLPDWLLAMIPAIQAVLAGSRDVRLADDPNLDYDDAAELLLLIESLPHATGA